MRLPQVGDGSLQTTTDNGRQVNADECLNIPPGGIPHACVAVGGRARFALGGQASLQPRV